MLAAAVVSVRILRDLETFQPCIALRTLLDIPGPVVCKKCRNTRPWALALRVFLGSTRVDPPGPGETSPGYLQPRPSVKESQI